MDIEDIRIGQIYRVIDNDGIENILQVGDLVRAIEFTSEFENLVYINRVDGKRILHFNNFGVFSRRLAEVDDAIDIAVWI